MNGKRSFEFKQCIWIFIKIGFIFFMGFFVGFYWFFYKADNIVWQENDDFSFSLWIESDPEIRNTLIEKTDAIQIYKGSRTPDSVYGFYSTLTTRELIFETRKRKKIETLINGIKPAPHTNDYKRCGLDEGEKEFHVIAYDHLMLQVGYLVVYICQDRGSEFAVLKYFSPENLGGDFLPNWKLPGIFKELGIN